MKEQLFVAREGIIFGALMVVESGGGGWWNEGREMRGRRRE